VFQTSEPWETGQTAVVFGSTDHILDIMQFADHDNVTSALQWVFVPLDMPQDVSSLGMSTLITQFACSSHRKTKLCNYILSSQMFETVLMAQLAI
jgi:hypothetical protein